MTYTVPTIPTPMILSWEKELRRRQAHIDRTLAAARRASQLQANVDAATKGLRWAEAEAAKWERVASPTHVQALKRQEEMMRAWSASSTNFSKAIEILMRPYPVQTVAVQLVKFEQASGVRFPAKVREPVMEAAASVDADDAAELDMPSPVAVMSAGFLQAIQVALQARAEAARQQLSTVNWDRVINLLVLAFTAGMFFLALHG